MIRMSRLTDYGIVLMTEMARRPDEVHTASEMASAVHLQLPTVSKLLRMLAKENLLVSHRGAKGGYSLARPAHRISVAGIIDALEGPIALTTCVENSPGLCEHETSCRVRHHWQHINAAIRTALDEITLDKMIRPRPVRPDLTLKIAGAAAARGGAADARHQASKRE